MKNRYSRILMAIFFFLAAGLIESKASHIQGSELTYSCVSPNVYVVECKIYRDCYGIANSLTLNLNLKSPGCNLNRVVTMNMVGYPIAGQPYCSSIPAICNNTSPLNYEEVLYRATVTFSAAEAQCTNWILSITDNTRVNSANVNNSVFGDFYTEAFLFLNNTVNNNSAQFPRFNVPYTFINQPAQVSSHAMDADGDSLVYSLDAPLTAASAPMSYNSYPLQIIYNSDSTKYLPLPGGAYSANFPLASYAVDWNLPMPITPVKYFKLNSSTGTLNFTPVAFKSNLNATMTENKYLVKVKVEEFRKLNGIATKVGAVSREMIIVVFNRKNYYPTIINALANGQSVTDGDIINLRPGVPLNFQFNTTDPNITEVLQVLSDVTTALPRAGFTATTAAFPAGSLSWTPNATHIRDQPYYFHLTVKDNSCPQRGISTTTFGVKVSATGSVTGNSEMLATEPYFSVFPNPFTHDLTFKLNNLNKAESITIYNLLGQQIDQVSLTGKNAGVQNVTWQNAGKFGSGIYFAKLITAGKMVQTLKFTKL